MIRDVDSFYDVIKKHSQTTPDSVAIVDHSQQLTYQQLQDNIDQRHTWLTEHIGEQSLVGLKFSATIWHVVTYLACFKAGVPMLILDAQISDNDAIKQANNIGANKFIGDNKLIITLKNTPTVTRSDLAILLSTSGSTGAAKSIMLSQQNLLSNAKSINQYLPMTAKDTGIASLPLSYSYGLSLLNSHLSIGARFVLTTESLISKTFWQLMADYQVTSLAGVPFSYQMLKRLKFEKMDLPALTYLTQAGGKLSADLVEYFYQITQQTQRKLYVMYGQTEASARIAYLPPCFLPEYSDCIGIAIPDGKLILRDLNNGSVITQPHVKGELCYQGPNVMLGYAINQDDLNSHKSLTELKTGDVAELTSNGLIKISGRLNRILKIQGKRFSLDHIEQILHQHTQTACYCFGEDDKLMIAIPSHIDIAIIKQFCSQQFNLHPSLFYIIQLDDIPRFSSGKPNYLQLMQLAKQRQKHVV
ncbi:MAG: AMP-binding protein [Shewanella sp.]|uniref:AMP-binding protein n=1 Tax=Shewanella sp. TaxID=50422 RepID=UPI00300328A3